MSKHDPSEGDKELDSSFSWGLMMKTAGQTNNDVRFYKSFTLDGVDYSLYDCVYVHTIGQCEMNIGKLVKMYEMPSNDKKVELVWFFRPVELRNFLGDYEPKWNELFLASGEGVGLSNVNALESIIGKCDVVCTSNVWKNSQPSEADLRSSNYIFRRTFNVGKLKISKKFPDEIAGVKVERYFNKKTEPKAVKPGCLENVQERTGKSSSFPKLNGDKVIGRAKEGVVKGSKNGAVVFAEENNFPDAEEAGALGSKLNHVVKETKNPGVTLRFKSKRSEDYLAADEVDIRPPKKRMIITKERETALMGEKEVKTPDKKALQGEQARGTKTDRQGEEASRRPSELQDRRYWFKQLPWEERMRSAHEEDKLVLLKNLDPSFTSSEVENLGWCAFKEKVEAKIIQHTLFSSPHCGEAFVLFQSKTAAEKALYKLQTQCLMLGDGRIVVGSKPALREPGKETNFAGHLKLDIIRLHREREEKRNAVAISHSSQPNTIEYDMAMTWRVLQKKSDIWFSTLFKRQRREMQDITSKLKIKLTRKL